MKRNLLLTLCCLLGLTASAGPISQQEALSHAQAYLEKQSTVRLLGGRPQQEVLSLAYECMPKASRGAMSSTDPLYYVFNRGNEGGFIVVAGDDRMTPVMACTDNGKFDKHTDNPGLQWWLEEAENAMLEIVLEQNTATYMCKNTQNTTFQSEIGPLLKTEWNQGDPYNSKCPFDDNSPTKHTNPKHKSGRAATGCVATAIAQVLYYWGSQGLLDQPKGIYSYKTDTHGKSIAADFSQFPIAWNNMLSNYQMASYNAEQKEAVANLMYVTGVSQKMDYCTIGSGAVSSLDALKEPFGLHKNGVKLFRYRFSTEEWVTMLKAELNAGRPVEYGGQSISGGHAFVCDGYNNQDLFHINWGWGGSDNGYFNISSLNSDINATGGSTTGTTGGYNRSQNAMFGFQPAKCNNPRAEDTNVYYDSFEVISVPYGDHQENTYNDYCIHLTHYESSYYRGHVGFGYYTDNDPTKDFKPVLEFPITGPVSNMVFMLNFEQRKNELPNGSYTFYPYKRVDGQPQILKHHGHGDNYEPTITITVNHDQKTVASVQQNQKSDVKVKSITIADNKDAFAGITNNLQVHFENKGEMFNGIIAAVRNNIVVAADIVFVEKNETDFILPFAIEAPAEGRKVMEGDVEVQYDDLEFVLNPSKIKGELDPSTGKKIPLSTNPKETVVSYKLNTSQTGTPNVSITLTGFNDNKKVVYLDEKCDFSYTLSNSSTADGAFDGDVTIYFDEIVGREQNLTIDSHHHTLLKGDKNTVNISKTVRAGNFKLVPYTKKFYAPGKQYWLLGDADQPRISVMNFHRTGDFIRVKNNGNYLTGKTAADSQAEMASDANANNIFFFDDGKVLSYGTGYYLSNNSDNSWVGYNGIQENAQKFNFVPAFVPSQSDDVSLNTQYRMYYTSGAANYYVKAGAAAKAPVTSTPENNTSAYNFTFEKVTSLPVTLREAPKGAGAYATLFTPVALTIPEGVKAYIGKLSADNTSLTLKKLEKNIPANTAVLLWSETKGEKEMPISTEQVNPIPDGENDFQGQVETIAKTDGETYLALGIGATSGNIGFHKSSAANLQGFRARLVFKNGQHVPANGFSLDMEGDDLTAIEEVEMEPEIDVIYDLSGRRIAAPDQRGVYIVNGKKVYLK